MPRSTSGAVLLCALLTLTPGAGCCQRGSTWSLAPVEGTVTKDGRPLANIQVTFWADPAAGTQGPRTCSFTDAAGHYELRTDTGARGAVIGRYRVCLVDAHQDSNFLGLLSKNVENAKVVQERMKQTQMEMSASSCVPLSYGLPDKTPLRVGVEPGPQVIDFDVKNTGIEIKLISVQGK